MWPVSCNGRALRFRLRKALLVLVATLLLRAILRAGGSLDGDSCGRGRTSFRAARARRRFRGPPASGAAPRRACAVVRPAAAPCCQFTAARARAGAVFGAGARRGRTPRMVACSHTSWCFANCRLRPTLSCSSRSSWCVVSTERRCRPDRLAFSRWSASYRGSSLCGTASASKKSLVE